MNRIRKENELAKCRFNDFVESALEEKIIPANIRASMKIKGNFQGIMNRKMLKSGRPVCYARGIWNPIKLNISKETLKSIKKENGTNND